MPFRLVGLLLASLVVTLGLSGPLAAQAPGGVSILCTNGGAIENGVRITVSQMRAGFTYTATAIGLNGFDPVLGVVGADGRGPCNDDDPVAATYSASLPTTGYVPSSGLSARVDFAQTSGQPLHDVSLVVGGFGNATGQFLVILEGMAITTSDVLGDPFFVTVTPSMVASGVPVTTYMIATDNVLDPLIYELDASGNIRQDTAGLDVGCDDAGTQSCWGQSASLIGSYVTTNRGRLGGGQLDAMLSLPVADMQLSPNPNENLVGMMMTSYQGNTLGQYIMAFHVGTAAPGLAPAQTQEVQPLQVQPTPLPVTPPPSNANIPQGMSVTCEAGGSFDNGVEIVVSQMRAGFTYTATAIGLNGFDPVLAVLGESGQGRCVDDDPVAATYSASLPTTGFVPSSGLSARLTFMQDSGEQLHDVSLVVGGYGNATGEFLLILEGMAITTSDVLGDPFFVNVTPGMVASGIPVTTYMIATDNVLDPLIYELDASGNIRQDTSGLDVGCDDAGTQSCWGQSASMVGSYVTTSRGRLGGGQLDAMLSLPTEGTQLSANRLDNYLSLLMTTYQGNTLGQYILAFHVGTAVPFQATA